MRCNYPTCRIEAKFIPVIELPTIRTKGTTLAAKPDESQFRNRNTFLMAMRIYDAAVKETTERGAEMSETTKPTYMVLREVCQQHRDTYRFQDWFRESDWNYVREAAKSKGFNIPQIHIVTITFKSMGWTPALEYMQLDRG